MAQGPTTRPDDQEKKQDELAGTDNMLLDDSEHKSYIYNIEQELASIEAQEKQISFLPDIERTLNAVPKYILEDPKPNNELVLYRIPRSLTVAEDEDNVRKAIIESRARATARQSEGSTQPASVTPSPHKDTSVFAFEFEAGDRMEIDSQQ